MKSRKGFTLVEILIVVVILGILAAIVIPQFSQASTEAREANLTSSLQSMRAQIELYAMQHLDNEPGTGTASFILCMTGQTDVNGAVWATGVAYGPYMRSIPLNPFNQLMDANRDGTVTVVATGARVAAGLDVTSWTYDTTNGDFYADDSKVSPDLTPHIDY
ncbi:MAG TPA: type II secretion system protein [Phycisphaerales bacterium]|nr:type II secretion system protein [Phycisphaerales bacterium]